jgi:hypothetical protein
MDHAMVEGTTVSEFAERIILNNLSKKIGENEQERELEQVT